LKKAKGKKTHVIIDVMTSYASGCNGELVRSYLGVLAHDKISILTPSFDLVFEVQRNIILVKHLLMCIFFIADDILYFKCGDA